MLLRESALCSHPVSDIWIIDGAVMAEHLCLRQSHSLPDLKLLTVYQSLRGKRLLKCAVNAPMPSPHTAYGCAEMCMEVFRYMAMLDGSPFKPLFPGGFWVDASATCMIPLHALSVRLGVNGLVKPTFHVTYRWKCHQMTATQQATGSIAM